MVTQKSRCIHVPFPHPLFLPAFSGGPTQTGIEFVGCFGDTQLWRVLYARVMLVGGHYSAGKGTVAHGCALGKKFGSFSTPRYSKVTLGVAHHVMMVVPPLEIYRDRGMTQNICLELVIMAWFEDVMKLLVADSCFSLVEQVNNWLLCLPFMGKRPRCGSCSRQ